MEFYNIDMNLFENEKKEVLDLLKDEKSFLSEEEFEIVLKKEFHNCLLNKYGIGVKILKLNSKGGVVDEF